MLTPVLEGPAHMLGDYDPRRMLPAIACPVLLLQADSRHGSALPDDEVQLALSLLPRASHVRLEGIGHALHGTHPHAVLHAITPFLESIAR